MTEFKVGDKVAVDLDIPESAWHKAEGYVIAERAHPDCAKVHVTKCDKTPSLVGAETTLYHLTLLAEVPVEDSGVGLSRYTTGMPDGVEPRHIMSEQKWYESFAKASILKYICRLDHKGQYLSDLKKIKTYAEELILLEESKTSE